MACPLIEATLGILIGGWVRCDFFSEGWKTQVQHRNVAKEDHHVRNDGRGPPPVKRTYQTLLSSFVNLLATIIADFRTQFASTDLSSTTHRLV